MRTRLRRGLSSIGTHVALSTTLVLVLGLAIVFAELIARERGRSVAARQAAASSVAALFAATTSVALAIDDADAIEKDVPVPTLTTALFTRFRSRQEESFAEKMLAALRNAFGGHAVRR